MVSISIREIEKDDAFLTSSGDKESAFAADTGTPPTSKTRFSKHYLKQYNELMENSPQPAEETNKQSTKPFVEKQKASVCQSSFEKQCGTINSLPF